MMTPDEAQRLRYHCIAQEVGRGGGFGYLTRDPRSLKPQIDRSKEVVMSEITAAQKKREKRLARNLRVTQGA